jgi:hypothetical protein
MSLSGNSFIDKKETTTAAEDFLARLQSHWGVSLHSIKDEINTVSLKQNGRKLLNETVTLINARLEEARAESAWLEEIDSKKGCCFLFWEEESLEQTAVKKQIYRFDVLKNELSEAIKIDDIVLKSNASP